jgi:hypothetical protein
VLSSKVGRLLIGLMRELLSNKEKIMNQEFTGVVGDPRTDPRVLNAWKSDEVLAEASVPIWKDKESMTIKKYPIWNQAGTSACVAFSKAKQLSIKIFNMTGVWIDFSPASIYQLRSNKPQGGMHIPNANEIVNTRGATLEALMKSQGLTEAQIEAVQRSKIADLFAKAIAEAVVSYVYIPVNMDSIAKAIESGKAVSLLVFATGSEYSRPVPVIENAGLTYEQASVRHEIVATNFFTVNGEKRIMIEDSAHFGGYAVREFTESFLTKRCILADALDVFTFNPGETTVAKPRYDGSIVSLQKCLRFEGLFPDNVEFTENFGPLTQKAVMKFQVKYGLHPTGVPSVGPKTKQKLLELFP